MGHLLSHPGNCSLSECHCTQVKLQPRVLGVFSKRLMPWTVGPSQLKLALGGFLLFTYLLLYSFSSILRFLKKFLLWEFWIVKVEGQACWGYLEKGRCGIGSRKMKTFVSSNSGFLCWEALGKAQERMDEKPVLYIWAFLWLKRGAQKGGMKEVRMEGLSGNGLPEASEMCILLCVSDFLGRSGK